MEKWEAAETSKNGPSVLTANSDWVHFQVRKRVIISVDKAHPYVEVPAPSTYISSTKTDGIETYTKITSATLDN